MATRFTDQKENAPSMTRLRRVYCRRTLCLFGQWFFTFWVLGITAQSLHISGALPSIVPMLAYTVSVAALHVVLTFYFVKTTKPASPTDARPPPWYMPTYAVSSLMWLATMACVVLVLVRTMPFANDIDRDGGLRNCGSRYHSYYKCYYSTNNAKVNTLAKLNMAAIGFIVLFILGHWFEFSKLWWQKFTLEEIGDAYNWDNQS